MPDWKDTVNLPRTGFSMKANLQTAEPEALARWEAAGLQQQLEERRRGAPKFVLHDGPPYANGQIHLGTALNKILKDLVIKSRSMAGFDAPYVPGYDCHGLPIELRVDRELGPKKKEMTRADIRRACRAYAERFIGVMTDEFKRLAVFGDWDHPYLTMNFRYQADIVRALGKFVERGLVYKGKKPVHWCIHCRTALAEAEVEYADHTSPSIYVEFPLAPSSASTLAQRVPALGGQKVSVLIWTTTPWTIPSNLAIAFHPEFDYAAYDVDGRAVIVAEELAPRVAQAVGQAVRLADRAHEGRGPRGHRVPASALRARLDWRARRVRHPRAGHGRGAHRAGARRRRLPHRREVRARDLRADRAGRPLPRDRGALRRRARVRRQSEGRAGAARAGAALAPRGVPAPVPALLALPQPGDLPRHIAVVRPHGRRPGRSSARTANGARCARPRSTPSTTR